MSTQDKKQRRAKASKGKNARTRVVAGSLVLYVVLGTLALGASRADGSPLVRQDTREGESRTSVRIDAAPLRRLLAEARRYEAQGELKIGGAVEINIEADRNNEDGTLSNVAVTGVPQGNVAIARLTEDFVHALDASRLFHSADEMNHLRLSLKLDGQQVALRAGLEFASDVRAAKTAQAYGGLLTIARILKRDRPETVVLNNMTVSSSGKQVALRLEMSRAELGNLLLKQITPN